MLAMSCVALAGLLYLAQANQASVLQYNIAELQVERVQLTAQDGTLRAAAMPLQSPQRIVSAAQTQLHMQQPNPSNTLWIAPTFSQVALPPSPAASSQAAQQRSQPLAWMRRVFGAVKASL
jgi:cell division protein FtsL